jgi:hypothetical protein
VADLDGGHRMEHLGPNSVLLWTWGLCLPTFHICSPQAEVAMSNCKSFPFLKDAGKPGCRLGTRPLLDEKLWNGLGPFPPEGHSDYILPHVPVPWIG